MNLDLISVNLKIFHLNFVTDVFKMRNINLDFLRQIGWQCLNLYLCNRGQKKTNLFVNSGRFTDNFQRHVHFDFFQKIYLIKINVKRDVGNWVNLDVFDKNRPFFIIDRKINNPGFAGLFKNLAKLACFNLNMNCLNLVTIHVCRDYPFASQALNLSSQNRPFLRSKRYLLHSGGILTEIEKGGQILEEIVILQVLWVDLPKFPFQISL